MRQLVRYISFSVVAVFGTAAAASADWCLSLDNAFYVFQNFSKPLKGACKPIVGNKIQGQAADTFPISGVACQNSSGDRLRIGFTWFTASITEHRHADLVLPDQTATSWDGVDVQATGPGADTTSGSVSLAPCNAQPIQ